jgi:hypothetical protein
MRRRLVLPSVLVGLLLLPAGAQALTVSRAQLSGGELRVEGSNAARGIFIIAESSTSTAGIRSDLNGGFKIQATGFRAPDCTIVVSDRQTPSATVKLSGCTPDPAAVNPPPPPPAPSGTCVIDPGAPATFTTGANSVYNFTTTGCIGGPLQWTVIAGRIPTGMSGPNFQGQTAGNIIGTPTTAGTYTFTAQVTDTTGFTDAETFTITVVDPQPQAQALAVSTPSTLPAGKRGHSYSATLTATGGASPYTWSLLSGSLPAGLHLSGDKITGTPTTRATSGFTLRVTDAAGATADRTFSIAVN